MTTGLSSFHGGHTIHGDGHATVRQMAAAAAARGMVAFGVSEHYDRAPSKQYIPPGKSDFLVGRTDWVPAYVADVRAAAVEYEGRLAIRLGSEVEYIRGGEAWTRQSLIQWPFEYLVGSVHYVRYEDEDIGIDGSRTRLDEALRRAGSAETLMLDYYQHVLELIGWRLVQVIGHLDLVKINLTPVEAQPSPAVRDKVEHVLEAMRDAGVAMDINCAGLRKPVGEIYPAPWIVERASALGIPVTLGDDSHQPEHVGAGLEQGVALLRNSGYTSLWTIGPHGALLEGPLPLA